MVLTAVAGACRPAAWPVLLLLQGCVTQVHAPWDTACRAASDCYRGEDCVAGSCVPAGEGGAADAARPDAARSDAARPDAAAPDAARPDAAGPDAAGPDAAGPDAAGPDAAGPDAAASDAAHEGCTGSLDEGTERCRVPGGGPLLQSELCARGVDPQGRAYTDVYVDADHGSFECDEYCAATGTTCLAAWDEDGNSCALGKATDCDDDHGDQICRCGT